MQLIESKPLLPTRRDVAIRVFRQRTVFFICFLLVTVGIMAIAPRLAVFGNSGRQTAAEWSASDRMMLAFLAKRKT